MRVLVIAVLAFAVVLAAPRPAAAWEGVSGGPNDPDLVALKQAMEHFRTELTQLREACAGARGDSVADCKKQYAALRDEFHQLKEQALDVVRHIHEWVKNEKEQLSQLQAEAERQQAKERDEAKVKSKATPERVKWLEDHMLQDKLDLQLAEQKAADARAEAGTLTGERHDEALAMGAKWDARAAALQQELARFESERAQLLAGAQKQKESAKKSAKDAKHTDLAKKLKALDETIAYKRSKLADLQKLLEYKLAQANATTGEERERWLDLAAGVREEIAQWTQYLNDLLAQRKELVAKMASGDAGTYREELTKQLNSIAETIAYKNGKIAELKALLAYKLAQAEATTGVEREEWLARAKGVQVDIDTYLGYLLELNAQRDAVIAKLQALSK